MSTDFPGFSKLFLKICFAGAAGALCVYCFFQMLNARGAAGVICNGVFLLLGLYLFGLLCAWFFAGNAADGFITFLLYPKRFLKSAPVILSRQQGLITAGNFEKAELELMELREKAPDSPEITLMLAELHGREFQDPAAAATDCRYYFARRSLRYHPLNLTIVLRYADWMQLLENQQEARSRLRIELHSFAYPPADRKALSKRLESLRNQRPKK